MAVTTAGDEKKPFRIEAAARGGIATILVGPDCFKYEVHRAVLTQHSEHFKKALEGPWKEAEEGVIRLEDVEAETFGLFVDWIDTQQPPSFETHYHNLLLEEKANVQILRIKACVFADRFLASGFARAMRHRLIFRIIHWESVQWPMVVYAFVSLPKDDQILQLLVDKQCRQAEIEMEFENDRSRNFILRAMRTYAKWEVHYEEVPQLKGCDYHDHATEEERTECEVQVKKQLSD